MYSFEGLVNRALHKNMKSSSVKDTGVLRIPNINTVMQIFRLRKEKIASEGRCVWGDLMIWFFFNFHTLGLSLFLSKVISYSD